jgi:hypothetical protein
MFESGNIFYLSPGISTRPLIIEKWIRSEIVGSTSSGDKSTVYEAVGGFSVFLARRISHSIYPFQVSSYVLRLVILSLCQ